MSNGNGWMPLYIGDYLGDTMELDAAQHGAYLLLLMYYWRNGPLPVDDVKLAQIARTDLRGWKKTVGPVVRAFFHERGGRLHQKRADIEIAKACECRERAAEKRHSDNDRLKAWWAKQGQDGHHPPQRTNGKDPPTETNETRFTGVSPPVSEGVSQRVGNADETRLTPTGTEKQVQEEREVFSKNLSTSLGTRGGAREKPPADGLDAVLAEAGVSQPKPGTVGAEVVQMHVRRAAKAMEMRVPYATVRSKNEQVDAALGQLPPVVEGADYHWGPVDPIRTPAEQYAAIMGCPLAEAEARLAISPRATADA